MKKSNTSNWFYDQIWQRGWDACLTWHDPKTIEWTIPTTGYDVIVSKEDYLWAMRYGWRMSKSGFVQRSSYDDPIRSGRNLNIEIISRMTGKDYGEFEKRFGFRGAVTFKNGNKLDYRRENLQFEYKGKVMIREASKKLRVNNTSGVTGVKWDKNRNKWHAQIQFKKKQYGKRFKDKEDAIAWRKSMEERFLNDSKNI